MHSKAPGTAVGPCQRTPSQSNTKACFERTNDADRSQPTCSTDTGADLDAAMPMCIDLLQLTVSAFRKANLENVADGRAAGQREQVQDPDDHYDDHKLSKGEPGLGTVGR